MESLAFQNRHLSSAHSISDTKLPWSYTIFSYSNNLSMARPPFSNLHHQFCKIETIVKYFYISLIDIVKIISVAKLNKKNLSYFETQNSKNCCEYYLFKDGLTCLKTCLGVNHKVKIVNFPGGASEKIIEKLDDIIKEQPDNFIVHVGTNDFTNNVNLLTNAK